MSDNQHLTIDCDGCSMQCTATCDDCVVTYVLRQPAGEHAIEFDPQETRVVHLLVKAGLVPELRYQAAS